VPARAAPPLPTARRTLRSAWPCWSPRDPTSSARASPGATDLVGAAVLGLAAVVATLDPSSLGPCLGTGRQAPPATASAGLATPSPDPPSPVLDLDP